VQYGIISSCSLYYHIYFVCSSRQENEELKAEYQRLQASYEELELIRGSHQENENVHHTSLTVAQNELDLSKSQASCNYLLVRFLFVLILIS